MYDATPLLAKLETLDRSGRKSKLLTSDAPVGHFLQSMRRLADPDLIEKFGQQVLKKPRHFISYRVLDGTAGAFELAASLLKRRRAVFWDRWCFPRRLVERREQVSSPPLDKYLLDQMAGCKIVWGVQSPKYAEPGSYSLIEKEAAMALGTFKPAPFGTLSKSARRMG